MMRIAALNESDSNDSDDCAQPEIATREAQEEEAFTLYNKALQLQNDNEYEAAEELYNKLLEADFLLKAVETDVDANNASAIVQPNVILKYSTYKNLANIAVQRNDYYKAMESYLYAISLDGSDVVVWYKIGMTAIKMHNYPLARLAFQEGLKCNPNHWPCLDNLITILYALNDYATCLYFIAQAFEMEPIYVKGLAIRDRIFTEHPSLRQDSIDLFKQCDESVFTFKYEKADAEKFIEESMEMRKIKRELSALPEPPILTFPCPWTAYSWKCLGKCLLTLYNHIWDSIPKLSFCCKVDLAKYLDPNCVETQSNSKSSTEIREATPVLADPISTLAADASTDVLPTVTAMEVDDVIVPLPADPIAVVNPVTLGDITRRIPKRKRILMEFGDPLSKRRSARVRNTGVTKKDEVNLCQLLQKFLPQSLLEPKLKKTVNPLTPLTVNVDKVANAAVENVSSSDDFRFDEEVIIRSFLTANSENGGVLDLMNQFLIDLSQRQNLTWPAGLTEVFIEVYDKLHKHTTRPSLLCQQVSDEFIRNEGAFTLIYCELQMDKWNLFRLKSTALSPPVWTSPTWQVACGFPGKFYREDLEFLVQLTVRQDILGDDWQQFFIRVMWLRAKFLALLNQTDFAIDSFDRITSYIEKDESLKDLKINIPNCEVDKVITLDQVHAQLESLRRCQSLFEINALYEAREYVQVVDLLTATFNQTPAKGKVNNRNIPERHAQLGLLQDSLWNMEDYQGCLYWGELSLNEAIQQYLSQTDKQHRSDWIVTLSTLLSHLERCLSKDVSLLDKLEVDSLSRLAHNLIRVISVQMELSEDNFDSVYPWILLYRIIDNEERKTSPSQPVESDENLPVVTPSLMLLYNAHDFLGRRSWCCNSDGDFLLLYSQVLLTELEKSRDRLHPYKDDVELSLEQCFYCLYGHPQKKTKNRYLQEHASPQLPLTLNRALTVFNYFKPKPLPEFDSHKANTISSELETLLKRFIALIPPQENSAAVSEKINAFIDGSSEELPTVVKEKDNPTRLLVDEVYYLLADYYFKNKEFGKAIRYYMSDICYNPERMDSWAGMALARSSQLEQLLNSVGGTEDDKKARKSDGSLYRKATCALRCFHGALKINQQNVTLWIEYGSLAYMVHSHVSRQLKQKDQLKLSSEKVDFLFAKRRELLSTSEHCFSSANKCDGETTDEEEWLHHYMLGKIAEKQAKPLEVCLSHYSQAAFYLHERGARYPRKIQYHNPPELSLEALEVFFRSHAATLKYLLAREDEKLGSDFCKRVYAYLKEASESPFALFQEKRSCESICSEELSPKTTLPSSPVDVSIKRMMMSHTYKNEHDYYRKKKRDATAQDEYELEARSRLSADSSSESLDSVMVKEVVNNILSVVAEQFPEENDSGKGIIVLGDSKIRATVSRGNSITISNELETTSMENDSHETIGNESLSLTPDDTETQTKSVKNNTNNTTVIKSKEDDVPVDQTKLVTMCLNGLRQCLQRFPQHYKSLHRLAYYHCKSKLNKKLHWSRDFLLGRSIPWQQIQYMPSQGLFNERKNSNLFNGIWRIPNDEIDRPGSFWFHMYRSVVLLGEVLVQLKDYFVLVNLITQLHRIPDAGKKYLRDNDRIIVANFVQKMTLSSLIKEMKRLCSTERTLENQEKIVKHILCVYRVWHNLQKATDGTGEVNRLLEDVYAIYLKRLEIPQTGPLLDQALKFCQQQINLTRSPKFTPQLDLTRTSLLSTAVSMDVDRKMASLLEDEERLRVAKSIMQQDSIPTKIESRDTSIQLAHKSTHTASSLKLPETTFTQKSLPNRPAQSSSTKKPQWTSNSIPVGGVVIGSMTITPVATNPVTTSGTATISSSATASEGLMSRLSNPKSSRGTGSPLNLSTNRQPVVSAFDPIKLTADVQSKITSLDPIEQASRSSQLSQSSSRSGFQMEFLRQIARNPQHNQAFRNSATKGVNKNIHQSHGSAHSAWGNRAPIAIPISSRSSISDDVDHGGDFKMTTIKKELLSKLDLGNDSGNNSNVATDLTIIPSLNINKLSDDSSHMTTSSPSSSAALLRSIRISTHEPAKRLITTVNKAPTSVPVVSKGGKESNKVSSPVEVITISSESNPEESPS